MSYHLSTQTSIFGLHLWIVLGVSAGAIFVLLLFLLSLCFTNRSTAHTQPDSIPIEITTPATTSHRLSATEQQALLKHDEDYASIPYPRIHIQMGKGHPHRVLYPKRFGGVTPIGNGHHSPAATAAARAVGQAEKEFEVEVEAIGRVRHKNLLRLLGYCAEGAHRILVYEYVNNGNLEQWVHGDVGPCSPLTWEIRMKIIIGIAKANILLDKSWNPKVSDFGLAKLLGADRSYITTRVMGTLGTGMVNERSDVYSFGILFMELISGRYPVDYKRPKEEVHLVDWLKKMVNEKCPEKVLDPKMIEKPSSSIVKRVLLVALRCVDSNSEKRPKIGHVVHMLESQDQSLIDERRGVRDYGSPNDGSNEKQMTR
ncbi:Protein kinase, catalytic domain-containing protein [Cynara cardunculus var. scolymus]|uniref:non-specific serine/threonine protein kinase n=1 Tax=Cynara cardunculus var. scolymus TaxID=59895 RepID=A0A103Y535_CYNCS|nr:Protein kinase, catalytic domain-containing protein [Cynara cardunculus var. scolymus]